MGGLDYPLSWCPVSFIPVGPDSASGQVVEECVWSLPLRISRAETMSEATVTTGADMKLDRLLPLNDSRVA